MVYLCADDYGLCKEISEHIQQCIDAGALNKVSVFPNFDAVDLQKIRNNKNIRMSLHLNLVEGKCMSEAYEIPLLADEKGNFKQTFIGLLVHSLIHRKKFEAQVCEEIRAQVLFWKKAIGEDVPFCIDSHQHTHMIPAVFRALLKVLSDEKIKPEHIRLPAEPFWIYIKTPSLYFTYSVVNVIKQWLLSFLWLLNKNQVKKHKIPVSHFFGILFSGKMDEKRVSKILPKYVKMAEKDGQDIEVLFHPGYIDKNKLGFKEKNVVFEKFYISENRKTELDSVMKISERSVL